MISMFYQKHVLNIQNKKELSYLKVLFLSKINKGGEILDAY